MNIRLSRSVALQSRLYGTISGGSKRNFDPRLSLQYFIESSKSRQLWRFIVRSTNQLPSNQRDELKEWARHDFMRHRQETDPERIKYLVAQGTKEVNDMVKYMQLPLQFEIPSFENKE